MVSGIIILAIGHESICKNSSLLNILDMEYIIQVNDYYCLITLPDSDTDLVHQTRWIHCTIQEMFTLHRLGSILCTVQESVSSNITNLSHKLIL